ncbi:MAG: hypothetical protein M3471_00245, partial [Actinomycetota bacterium]|nr:hypothetical protein [Actinomycetota bacterium]
MCLAIVGSVVSVAGPAQSSPDHGAALDESGAGGFIGLNPVGPDPEEVITVGEPASTEEGAEPVSPR